MSTTNNPNAGRPPSNAPGRSAAQLLASLDVMDARIAAASAYLGLDALGQHRAQLEAETAAPQLWADADQARAITTALATVTATLATHARLTAAVTDARSWCELADDDDPHALAEAARLLDEAAAALESLERAAFFAGAWDDHDAVVEVHAGEGGVDAADFAEMLVRMYQRWAQHRGYAFSVVTSTPGAEAGLATATATVHGDHAYGWLRGEQGAHRLVRMSPFNAQGKRQTAFASVTVVPVLEPSDNSVVIDDADVRIDVYRASGAGGQHVNKTDSAVRITHLPTGIVVACQNERSQLQNKTQALRILAARLADRARQQHDDALAAIKGTVTSAGFGARIRSYVLHPNAMVRDERSRWSTPDVYGFLGGDLDACLEAYLRWSASDAPPSSWQAP